MVKKAKQDHVVSERDKGVQNPHTHSQQSRNMQEVSDVKNLVGLISDNTDTCLEKKTYTVYCKADSEVKLKTLRSILHVGEHCAALLEQ